MAADRFKALPVSRDDIRRLTQGIRKVCGVADDPHFPIVEVIEFALPAIAPGFTWQVVEMSDLRGAHADTDPIGKVIRLGVDTYERAVAGAGRDRMTLAHEVGHAIMHKPAHLQRMIGAHAPRTFECPEWQAKAFAGELLFSFTHVGRFRSSAAAARACGISYDAAEVMWGVYQRQGLVKTGTRS